MRQGRAAPGWAVGTGWLSLKERQEPWPRSPPLLPPAASAAAGSVPTLSVEAFGEHRVWKELKHQRGLGAVRWELLWWQRHGLYRLVAVAKDSLTSPQWNVGAPRVLPRPSSVHSCSWGGKGLRGLGVLQPLPMAPRACGCRCLLLEVLVCPQSRDLLGMSGTWWKVSHAWSAGMEHPGCSGGAIRAGKAQVLHCVYSRGLTVQPLPSVMTWLRPPGEDELAVKQSSSCGCLLPIAHLGCQP